MSTRIDIPRDAIEWRLSMRHDDILLLDMPLAARDVLENLVLPEA